MDFEAPKLWDVQSGGFIPLRPDSPTHRPTDPFTILESLQNPSINKLYVFQKRWTTDFEALKL